MRNTNSTNTGGDRRCSGMTNTSCFNSKHIIEADTCQDNEGKSFNTICTKSVKLINVGHTRDTVYQRMLLY